MEVYTIYHIPGIKVGCTKDLKRRTSQNKRKYGKDITVEVLQMTTSLEMADEMENVYSMELGYGEIEKQDRYEVRYKVGQNPERNRKISSKLLGKPKSKEHRKAMSDNSPKYWLGKKQSEESTKKRSESLKGRDAWNKGVTGYTKVDSPIYRELTTGTEGTSVQLARHFDIKPVQIYCYAKIGGPVKKGTNKGLHLVRLDK